jgi:PAS domain S-box-containing protein
MGIKKGGTKTRIYSTTEDSMESSFLTSAITNSLFKNTKDCVAVVSPTLKILRLSQSFKTLSGYDPEKYVGKSVVTLPVFDIKAKATIAKHVKDALSTKKTQSYDVLFTKKNRNDGTVNITSDVIFEKGKVIGFLAFVREKTDEAEVQFQFKKAQEIAKIGSWEYTIQTKMFHGSEQAKQMYGFSDKEKELTTDMVESCIPERKRVHNALIDLISKKKPYDLVFDIIPQGSKQKRTIHSVAELEYDAKGKPLRVVGVIQDITEQSQNLTQLKESENKFRQLTETMFDIAIEIDLNGKITKHIKGGEELLKNPKNLSDKNIFSFIPSKYRKTVIKEMQKSKRIKSSHIPAIEICLAGKQTKYFEVFSQFINDINGNITGSLVVLRDIDSLITSKNAMEQNERKFRLIFEKSPNAIVLLDLKGNCIDANARFHEWLGYNLKDLIGKNLAFWPHLSLQSKAKAMSLFLRRLKGENLPPCELEFKHKKGHTVYGELTGSLIKDDQGKIWADLIIIRNATEEKRAREETEQTQNRFFRMIAAASESIVVTDATGTIEYVNPFFEKITGYKKNEVLGKNPRVLKSGRQSEEFYKNMWETLTRGETWRGEFVNKTKKGKEFTEMATITPIKDDKGNIINYIAMKYDISEQKRNEKREQEYIKEMEQFQDVVVDRELRMTEMEKQVATLQKQLKKQKVGK